MSDVDYIGTERVPAETRFEAQRYRVTCQCQRCGNEYSWETTKLTRKDRPCPRKACKEAIRQEEIIEAAKKFAGILENGAPAVIGRNVYVKAADQTAEMVMEDFKMTDLRDNIGPGEMAAPKLPAPMQKAADGFFGGTHAKAAVGGYNAKRMEAIGKKAIAGAYRGSAINPAQLVGGTSGAPSFRSVGKG